MSSIQRIVHNTDSLLWMRDQPHPISNSSIVTSIPDVSELGRTYEYWVDFFQQSAVEMTKIIDPNGLIIFIQTDIKWNGTWIDKGFLLQQAMQDTNFRLRLRKIIYSDKSNSTGGKKAKYSQM